MDQQVMKKNRPFQCGITMIEVMVSVAIIAIVMALGIPNLSSWMQNTQVKSTAESVLTGLQLARAEAVRQNTKTRFQLTDTTGMASWAISTPVLDRTDCPVSTDPYPCLVQSGAASESGQNARLGVSTASLSSTDYSTAIAAGAGMGLSPTVIFDAFGRADSSVTNITRIDVTNSNYANARRLVISITDSGMVKLCDPLLSNLTPPNPRGCS
jgi:type IV fimbrial biogenesis protein FimT